MLAAVLAVAAGLLTLTPAAHADQRPYPDRPSMAVLDRQAAAGDAGVRTNCTATDDHGVHWAGYVTLTGTLHYNSHGGVTLRNARITAHGQMFTITSSRWRDEALNITLARGYTGVLSPGESTRSWTSGEYASRHWGHWAVRGHRTNAPAAVLRSCGVWG